MPLFKLWRCHSTLKHDPAISNCLFKHLQFGYIHRGNHPNASQAYKQSSLLQCIAGYWLRIITFTNAEFNDLHMNHAVCRENNCRAPNTPPPGFLDMGHQHKPSIAHGYGHGDPKALAGDDKLGSGRSHPPSLLQRLARCGGTGAVLTKVRL